jgi:hypothetical protein
MIAQRGHRSPDERGADMDKAIDDLEPLGETPALPPGDGLDIVRHNVFDCIAICEDDLAAGLLLFKMIMLGRYSKLMIDGERWYVRPRAKLCRDVRLTRHQYDRALKLLKAQGYVRTRKVPFELIHAYGPFTAFRVTKTAAMKLKIFAKKKGPIDSKITPKLP